MCPPAHLGLPIIALRLVAIGNRPRTNRREIDGHFQAFLPDPASSRSSDFGEAQREHLASGRL